MRKTTLLAAFLGVSLAAAGCVVHEREVVTERPPAPPCHGAVWVEAGNHSHWDCPTEKVYVKVTP
jgi:hypothetical protein